MPPTDNRKDDEAHEPAREGDREKDRERDKGGKSKGSAKTKDLSHVPFLEPGQQKEVCAWFMKGNCKFGHKCALAHILPGQSMSMDRKNKKAAQLAANAANTAAGGGRDGGRGGGRSGKGGSQGGGNGGSQSRNPLLSGSTAPTRAISNTSRTAIPMPLKATLSPSTPAPPVKDTDFASFGLPDESNKLPTAPAQRKSSAAQGSANSSEFVQDITQVETEKADESSTSENVSLSPIPVSTPSAPRRVGNAQHSSPNGVDFGPIGSPPRASSSVTRTSRINGFSPGTSPNAAAGLPASPFSAPGTQTVFVINDADDSANGFKGRSGLSASLGTMMNWSTDRHPRGMNARGVAGEVVVEDEDFEEFIPSSLTDLLTPEERSRRFSRTNGNRPTMISPEHDTMSGQRSSAEGHRYSRSVPAPSLMQDIRSIWADSGNGNEIGGSGGSVLGGGLGNGTPSSFQSNSGLSGRLPVEEMLAPSNASAAFLPGLHHNYMNAKNQRSNLLSGMSSLHANASNNISHNIHPSAYGAGLNAGALSPPRTSVLGNRTSLDYISADVNVSQSTHLRASGRTILGGNDAFAQDVDDRRSAASPSARALQAHAPGQSLPQGLAAGYSRIHAQPPPVIASPSTPGAFSQLGGFSPGTKVFGHAQSASGEWHSMSPGTGNSLDQLSQSITAQTSINPGTTSMGGLEAMFSRLSYSAAASRGGTTPMGSGARNPSGRSYNPQGSLSPLSGPVLTGDDDDLFSMDG
ncbi:uncharacterized protein FIBRA_00756 [Fibroporia radiculosa]|uniref:C3H1-type domain-containing protein n=1 Tax=Fibroporia radiculosa TaxID=599839 RepID=J4I841_9APHY|nr:uncharacterized protein FIBRA_00756 [Fibroporia radiculosa]CCL98751.1 predicted protein [Fibroporia radiculosa]